MKQYDNITVTYYELEDLSLDTIKRLNKGEITINDITYHDLKNPKLIIKESVVILKIGEKYKLLKSRY
jgi:hypothetical protein